MVKLLRKPSPLMGEGLGGADVNEVRALSGDITPPQPFPIKGRGYGFRTDANLLATPMRLALFEPEIAGNVGAVMRLGACFGVAVDLIEPLGFDWDDKRVRRTAMDYIDHVDVSRHASFDAFRSATPGRVILFTTKGDRSPYDFEFRSDDILLFGKESGGVPADVANMADAKLRIPIRTEVRSFNLATSAALALGEALRQTGELPQ
jgi:tRNA (cytidine/uridine-2'-O-)-methyltransferase